MRAFILNCKNEIVGNPRGYKNTRTALAFVEGKSEAARKIMAEIYTAFDARTDTSNHLLYTVKEKE